MCPFFFFLLLLSVRVTRRGRCRLNQLMAKILEEIPSAAALEGGGEAETRSDEATAAAEDEADVADPSAAAAEAPAETAEESAEKESKATSA